DRQGGAATGGDRGGRREPADRYGDVRVGVRPVPELTEGVVSPGPDRAVVLERQGMGAAPGDRGDPREPADGYREARVGVRPVPELIVIVGSPGPDRAVVAQRHGVGGATCDGPNAAGQERPCKPSDCARQ